MSGAQRQPPAPGGRRGSLALAEFLKTRGKDAALARLTHNVRFPQARGLEFGAANAPTLLPDGHHVEYVDYAAQPEGADSSWVPIDHLWSGAGSLAAVCGEGQSYDFAIARQVAHLVPNLLGWFNGVFEVLEPGGVFNLGLPDHRFTTDCARPPSTIAEAVEASIQDKACPSSRQVFDHFYSAREIAPGERWQRPSAPADLPRVHGAAALDHAYRQSQAVTDSAPYPLCHCWVFTPLSFLSLMEDASRLSLFPFVFNQLSLTEPGEHTFFVSLRRDEETDPGRRLALQLGAIAHLRGIADRHKLLARRMAES